MNNSRIYSIVVICLYVLALAIPANASQDKKEWDRLAIQLGCDKTLQTSAQANRTVWTVHQDPDSNTLLNPVPAPDRPLQAFAQSEQTLIPLPSGELTGLAGLAGLALVRARKTLRRFFL